jgi:hypothetical protein
MSPTNNWSKKERTQLRKVAGKYSTDHFFLDIEKSFIEQGYEDLKFQIIETTESDKDPRILKIFYPALITQNGNYMEPYVQVELSSRSLREPFSDRKIESLVDTHFSGKDFAMESFMVPTVNPERTFLEKLFLLHEEFHRPVEKRRVTRLSRHLYDVYQLAQVGINELASHALKYIHPPGQTPAPSQRLQRAGIERMGRVRRCHLGRQSTKWAALDP